MGEEFDTSRVESLRREMASEIARVEGVLGTQIGAVEKTVTAKIDGLDRGLWLKLAVAGIGNIAAVVGLLVLRQPQAATDTARAALSVVSGLF